MATPPKPLEQWTKACIAIDLVAHEPRLGGIWLRAGAGPVRDAFLAALSLGGINPRKIHPHITDEQLFTSIDLSATLASGSLVRSQGVLHSHRQLLLTMAERCESGLAARLAGAMDDGTSLIALDESVEGEDGLPDVLRDRLAFWIDLDGLRLGDLARYRARALGPLPAMDDAARTTIVEAAAAFGVSSSRKLYHACLTARAIAAREGADRIGDAHIVGALEMVIAPAAMHLPQPQDEAQPEPQPETRDDAPPEQSDREESETNDPQSIPKDILVEAIKAALPPGLLDTLIKSGATRGARTSAGSGATHKGNRRGRPLPSRAGALRSGARIDLVASLRAAAPWQPLRRRTSRTSRTPHTPHRVHIHTSDLRIKQFESRSDRLIVFTVDASGSAAMARLAETKGAIEIVLGEAYARRDHVALVAFRGTDAQVLLPPTRSLVQTKRRLAALAGGGGTPLAAGLQVASETCLKARTKGMTPTLTLMTDGRANIALDGQANRSQANTDALSRARQIRSLGLQTLVIDTGMRPSPALRELVSTMDGEYVALPRADARKLAATISAGTG